MTALADLQAAVQNVVTLLGEAVTLINNLTSGSVSAADVEAQVAALNAAATTAGAVIAPPAPAPAPAPAPTPTLG